MFSALPILEVSSPVVPSRALALALPQSSRLSISRGDSDYLNLLSSIDEGCLPPLIPSPSAKSRPKVLMITSQTSVPRFTRVENCVFLTFFGCGAPPHCTSQSQPTQPVLSHHWADPRRDRSCSSRCRQRFASKPALRVKTYFVPFVRVPVVGNSGRSGHGGRRRHDRRNRPHHLRPSG